MKDVFVLQIITNLPNRISIAEYRFVSIGTCKFKLVAVGYRDGTQTATSHITNPSHFLYIPQNVTSSWEHIN